MSQLEEFEEWLPWYVNGTLNARDRAAMDAYLARTPVAMEELRYYQRMADTMKRRIDTIPADIGLEKTLARNRLSPKRRPARVDAGRHAGNWLQRMLGGGWMKPALGVTMAIIIGQAVLLSQQRNDALVYRGGKASTSTASQAAATEFVYLRVIFKPSATEGELRVLFASTHAWVAGGPGAAGEYYLRFTPDRAQSALETLRTSGVTNEVMPVNQLPVAP